jgi:limonene-1,2-epoxide hydrolase
MATPEEIIQSFYTAFQNKDYRTMQSLYANEAVFNDEVFKNLQAPEVRSMWEMLIKRGTDLQLSFSNVEANGNQVSARWEAVYSFGPKKRKVINKIHARFEIANGRIIQHTDSFSFYTWARQALGLPGLLLGWTGYLQKKVQKTAMKGLQTYMEQH